MQQPYNSESIPLRAAIIGSGPSGFYAAEHLLKQLGERIEIDMFERLPTPFGLVRGGVAPDHQKIKSVTNIYDRIASHPHFRFYGNVTFGRDILRADLANHYHIVIYAVGAQTDRQMNIPGEDLPGSHAATEFVGWYNAHPDYRDLEFDLSQERVVVVGNGNVAMDVVRILAHSGAKLHSTDIADYALHALRSSRIKEVVVLGRRGPVQAAFTNPEIKELEDLEEADILVAPEDVELDPLSRRYLHNEADRTATRNVQILTRYAEKPVSGRPKKIIMRFLVSPVEIIGTDRVEAVKIVKNELYLRDDGTLRPRATGEYEIIPAGLVFRSIGYRGVPLRDVPFDEASGTIPNEQGRIIDPAGEFVQGEYAVGWIKRGANGIIGTNKADAQETVQHILEDIQHSKLLTPAESSREALEELLALRQVRHVTYADWQIIDQLEQERGQAQGRPRLKFSSVDEMLDALTERKNTPVHLMAAGD